MYINILDLWFVFAPLTLSYGDESICNHVTQHYLSKPRLQIHVPSLHLSRSIGQHVAKCKCKHICYEITELHSHDSFACLNAFRLRPWQFIFSFLVTQRPYPQSTHSLSITVFSIPCIKPSFLSSNRRCGAEAEPTKHLVVAFEGLS